MNANIAPSLPPRKGPGSEGVVSNRLPSVSPYLEGKIEERAVELHAEGQRGEISKTIAREFFPEMKRADAEVLVDRTLAELLMRYRMREAILLCGMKGTLDQHSRVKKDMREAA